MSPFGLQNWGFTWISPPNTTVQTQLLLGCPKSLGFESAGKQRRCSKRTGNEVTCLNEDCKESQNPWLILIGGCAHFRFRRNLDHAIPGPQTTMGILSQLVENITLSVVSPMVIQNKNHIQPRIRLRLLSNSAATDVRSVPVAWLRGLRLPGLRPTQKQALLVVLMAGDRLP